MTIFGQFLSLNIAEHDPDYWAKDEELRLALVAAGEEFDYMVQNARVLLLHKVGRKIVVGLIWFARLYLTMRR